MIYKWLATAAVNGLLFLVAAVVGVNVSYRLTNSPALLLLIVSIALAAAGAFARAWSTQVSMVAIPATVVSIALITLLTMEAYLGDGGDPDIMWRHIPGVVGLLGALATAGSAYGGWALSGRLRRVYSPAAEQ